MHVTLQSIIPQTSQETDVLFHRVQKVVFLSCDWWISTHSACFCFKMTVTIMIDDSIKPNRMLGFELQRSHVIERRYNNLILILGFKIKSQIQGMFLAFSAV